VLGAAVAALGALATVVLVGVFAVHTGLLIIAYLIGRFVAAGVRSGAGATLDPRDRANLSITLATIGVIGGHLGTWLYAVGEGGALGPMDYLAQTFGLLVPIQLAIAVGVAWWTSR
jgi:hypothetical protein